MKIQNGAPASTGSACLKKATELFYVTHPKVPKALLGPFLTEADAECGRVVMRSAGAQVTACLVDSIDSRLKDLITVMELIMLKIPWLFFSRPSRRLRRQPPSFLACFKVNQK